MSEATSTALIWAIRSEHKKGDWFCDHCEELWPCAAVKVADELEAVHKMREDILTLHMPGPHPTRDEGSIRICLECTSIANHDRVTYIWPCKTVKLVMLDE